MRSDWELAQDHKYVARHGRKPAPGVTTIINGSTNKSGMPYSAAMITAEIALTQKIPRRGYQNRYDWLRRQFDVQWKEKRDRGSSIHNHALDWANGRPVVVQPDEEPYLDALERFTNEHKPDWVLLETVVISGAEADRDYGGRLDFIADLGSVTVLGDIKTGGKHLEGPTLQLAAYACAEGTAEYAENGDLTGATPLPPIDARCALFLEATGEYDLIQLDDDPAVFDAFLHARSLYEWRMRSFNPWERAFNKARKIEESNATEERSD